MAAVIDLREPQEVIDLREPTTPTTTTVSLTVVMPVYNEEATVEEAVRAVLAVDLPCEAHLVVVDDGSTDATPDILAAVEATLADPRLVVLRHQRNAGKGAALRTGAAAASTTHVVPFDADLEYDPEDLARLLVPVLAGEADIVYGTRRQRHGVPHGSRLYAVGNALMTLAANALYDSRITDLHTCLKLVPLDLFRQLPLLEEGFGLDTELTAWLLRTGAPVWEVPVSYRSRSRVEGKKICWRDSIVCFHLLYLIRRERPPAVPVGGA